MKIHAFKFPIILTILSCVSFFLPPSSQSQVFTSADLTVPLEETGVSARALALGSSFAAVPGDLSAMVFNPATLGTLRSFQVGLHHQSWLDNFFQETLMASFPLKGLGAGGLSLGYLDHGTFAGRDINGDPTTGYRSYRLSLSIGWGLPLFPDLFLGLSGRGLQQTIADKNFQAAALDAGILWQPFPGADLGLSYSGLGTDVDNFLLAARFRAGASYGFNPASNHQALVTFDYSREPYNDAHLHLGLEDCVGGLFSLRAGYLLDLYENEVSGFHGLSAGLGVHLNSLALDYAYLPGGDLGSTQRISVQYDFGGSPAAPTAAPTASPTATSTPPTPGPIVTPNPPTPSALSATNPGDNLKLYFMVPAETPGTSSASETNAEVKRLTGLIKEDPQNTRAWMDLGSVYYRLGRKEWAIQCFDQVLRLNPDAVKLRDWLDRYRKSGE